MSNMERLEIAKNYWADVFVPKSALENRLITLIAFQDLLMERSMTIALSTHDEERAAAAERRQNDLVVTLDRLVNLLNSVQSERALSRTRNKAA